ncbi:MAG: hypothetical protein V1886_00155 [archaeon]
MDTLVEYAIRWWIKDYKWIHSKQEGRDIGVPATVDILLGKRKIDTMFAGKEFHGVTLSIHEIKPEYRIPMIEGYLLIPEIPDSDGINQLEGELKRFEAQKKSISPSEVRVTRDIVQDYCKEYDLEEILQKFLIKLKIE